MESGLIGSVIRASLIVLGTFSMGLFQGCGDGRETYFISGNPGTRRSVNGWPFVRTWMKESPEFDWYDRIYGFNEQGGEDFSVYFAPAWGGAYMMIYDVTNVCCRNLSSDRLDIQAFPTFANAVELEGAFDLSRVKIGGNVECFGWEASPTTLEYTTNSIDQLLPSFSAPDRLRRMELRFPHNEVGHDFVPVLDLERFAGFRNLRRVSFSTCFPQTNIDLFLDGAHPEVAVFDMIYINQEWHSGGKEREDEMVYEEVMDSGGDLAIWPLRGSFDDRTFHELSQLEFGDYTTIDIKIYLTEIRHLDLSRLLSGNWSDLDIRISAHNCIIDNLPCVIDYDCKKRLSVDVEMLIETERDPDKFMVDRKAFLFNVLTD